MQERNALMDIAPSSCAATRFDEPAGECAGTEPAVLFFDVDGTLIWTDDDAMEAGASFSDFLPNSYVREAFERLHERGHQAYLCTGRPLSIIPQGLLDLGFAGCISGAGSCISLGDQVVYEALIPREVLLRMASLALERGIEVFLESHTTPVILAATHEPKTGFTSIPTACSLDELEQLAPNLEFCKMTHMGGADWHEGEFGQLIDAYFTEFDMGLASELGMRGVDKGSAIGRVLKLTGHGRRNTYAFGDSENDMPMFAAVETSVAMGNAMARVKEHVDYVTGHANKDGVLRALEHFGLI